MKFFVKTSTSLEYLFDAHRFEIHDGIAHFYTEEGTPKWVIKDWISFGLEDEAEEKALTPDEYYENLEEK